MRRRIVTAMVGVLAAALLAFAIPLGVAVRGGLVARALDGLQAQTEQVAVFIDTRARTCGEVDLILGAASRERPAALSRFTPGGRLLATVAGHDPTVGSEFDRAAVGAAGRRSGGGSLAVAVPLSTDVCERAQVLHAEQPDDAVRSQVRRAWLGLTLVGLAVLALAAAVGAWLAGRLARPLRDLADSAAALGDGDFSVRAPRSDLPEVDAIADTLDRTAGRLGRAVDRARTFAADASHQLRTPMTALRLHLEGLQARGVEPEQVEAALLEADRLEATVAELVALTSLETAEEEVEPEALVAPPVEAARTTARTAGRDVVVEVVPSPPVRTRPAAVRQALQVLLDNALQHGTGTVEVRVTPTLPDEGVADARRGLRISVADEGPGPDTDALAVLRSRDRGAVLPATGGRGLALARMLVEGEGGRLTAETVEGRTRTVLVLPVSTT